MKKMKKPCKISLTMLNFKSCTCNSMFKALILMMKVKLTKKRKMKRRKMMMLGK